MIARRQFPSRSVGLFVVVFLLATGLACGDSVDARLERVMARLAQRPPEAFEERIRNDAQTGLGELRELAGVAATAPPDERAELAGYLSAAARSRARHLSSQGPPFDGEELAGWLSLVFLDPARIAADPEFRRFALEVARGAHDAAISDELRGELLRHISGIDGLEFAQLESIELAWGTARRSSAAREVPYEVGNGRIVDDLAGPIAASVYSLPSGLIEPVAAYRFLNAVQAAAPGRSIVVLSDPPFAESLNRRGIPVIRSRGAPYSPWPRDPFSLMRRADDGVLLLLRPNVQRLREADNTMGLRLIQGLPESLDRAWLEPVWERSPVPFHNGQLLTASDSIWLSAHSLEPRILQLLGEPVVPVRELGTGPGWQRYANAAEQAAAEIGRLFGRTPLFVHPMDGNDDAFLTALGGGAGYDLDSLVTPLRGPDGKVNALVADAAEGARLLEAAAVDEVDTFARLFRLTSAGETLRRQLLESQRDAPAVGLGRFADLVAAQLKRSGIRVERLPLLLVPAELAPRPDAPLGQPFLISWNNTVQEFRRGQRRSEGFASGLASGDERARRRFNALDYRLELFPPLVESVVRNGGYRCASQHLRW